MITCGVDPGANGAVAVLDKSGKLLQVSDTPTIVVKRGGGKRTEYLPKNMTEILREALLIGHRQNEQVLVYLEHVHSMPKQGVRSMFSMGVGFGVWCGIIAALDLPLEYITPQVWKKTLGLSGSDKSASILKAQQIIPGAAPYLTLKKHDGRAEACLIAEYGRRRSLGIGFQAPSRS